MIEHRDTNGSVIVETEDIEAPTTELTPVEAYVFEPFQGDPYRVALQSSVSAMATSLQDLLSRRITAYTVGVKDVKTITRWANQDVRDVRDEAVERKLRTTYQVALLLLTVDAPPTVKSWFLGMNPYLDDLSPVEAIRSGKEREALDAARAFVAGA